MTADPEARQYRWVPGEYVGLRSGLPEEPDLAQYAITPTGWGQAAFDVQCLRCQPGDREVAGWITDGGETVTLAEVMAAIQDHHDTRHRTDPDA